MHRRRLPAGVPLPARAGVAWSGFSRTCRAVGFCAAVRSERVLTGTGHYRPPPARSCPLVAFAPAPGVDARVFARAARPVAGRDHSHVLRRVLSRRRSWGFPIARPFAGFVPRPGVAVVSASRDARRLLASRVRRFRPRRAHVPFASRPAPSGLARGTGRPVWENPVRAAIRTIRPRTVGAITGGRPGFWASLPRTIRVRRRSSFSAGAILPWVFGPLSGVRTKQTCSTRSSRRS